MITYLLQVTLCLAFFYTFYHFALRRETMFQTNRFYLLSTLMLSLGLPLIRIYIDATSIESSFMTVPYDYVGSYFYTIPETIIISPKEQGISWGVLLMTIYLAGLLVMVIRLSRALRQILQVRRCGIKTELAGRVCILSEKVAAPYSFFNTIYLPVNHGFQESELMEVMQHEEAHVREKHTLDVIWMELICIAFWPSPMVYLYRKSLREVHEFVADAKVLKQTQWEKYAHLLISQQQHQLQNALSNHFIYSQLKKRLLMMTQRPSSAQARFKYLGIVPILLIAILLISFKVKESSLESQGVVANLLDTLPESYITALRLTEPEGDSENINNNETTDRLSEKNLGYEMPLPLFPGCDDVAFSHRGQCSMTKLGEYVNANMTYPESIKKAGIEGRVVVKIVVGIDGYLKDVSISESLHPDADQVVLQLFLGMNDKVGQWLPARKEGKTVEAELQLPIKFVLDETIQKAEPLKEVDEIARFPGCEEISDLEKRSHCAQGKMFEFIYTNIVYPKLDRQNNVEGTGFVRFVIEPDGSISGIKVLRSPSQSIGAELVRIVTEMAILPDKWIPAQKDGKAVPYQLTLPVKFVLQDDAAKSTNSGTPHTQSDHRVPPSVAPNPANNRISFDIFQDTHTINIFDNMSKQVISYSVEKGNSKRQSVDISSLIPGSYVVQLISDTNTTSLAFTIVR